MAKMFRQRMCRRFIEPFALVEVQVLANLVAANRMVPHLMTSAYASRLPPGAG
ncbi:hypothetical protein LP414_22120 [Polaromonas sp. P1(28)-13]|nr:hypothetical protein LP417_07425 [Polaromonas sp. P1-6]UUZ67222.1 hypothetical protein LP416_20600 [Polaromonas sp. P2-4]UUZ74855.1 hypothetical protein LP414_22120 [Polaromonas sp. P1(28)-13]